MSSPSLRSSLVAVVVLLAGGCGTAEAPTMTPTPAPASVSASTPTSPVTTAAPTSSAPVSSTGAAGLDNAVLEPGGLGPLRVGMPLAEVRANGWAGRDEVCNDWDANRQLRDKGVSIAFDQDRVYEIWVAEPTFATAKGIRVGATLAQLQQAYGSQLRTETRQGGGGPYTARFVQDGDKELLFLAESPDDTRTKAILARTAGTEVIEGC